MNPLDLFLGAAALAALSGVPGLLARRGASWAQRVAVAGMGSGALLGLLGVLLQFLSPAAKLQILPWPAVGDVMVGGDPLTAFFLVPVFLVGGLGSVYGLGYWACADKPRTAAKLQFFWGLLVAAMVLVLVARHALGFLLGWEVMALAAFFLITTEDHRPETRAAGWTYLMAAHLSTLTLFGLFALWYRATGSFLLVPVAPATLGPGSANLFFFLALLGFGLKAGIMPLHFWLPDAHAGAPSHVSAIFSGVVLKMGVYGILRVLSLLPTPPPLLWGLTLLLLGAVSGILGVVFALGQPTLKRLLAYSSVENLGIVIMALGLAVLGQSVGRPDWTVLGMAGCLLHVWNHSLFKSLLFLGAGAVIHSAQTQELEELGGLAKTMPWTAGMFCLGSLAICGLPPLNGFVGEFLIYLGLLRSVGHEGALGLILMLAIPALALIGALALVTFVTAFGILFLGTPRSQMASRAHEAPASMLWPMGVLAALCVLVGFFPVGLGKILDPVLASWQGSRGLPLLSPLRSLAPLGWVGLLAGLFTLLVAVPGWLLASKVRAARRVVTWDCGYSGICHRNQYTASSFTQGVVEMFAWVLHPFREWPVLVGPFPGPARLRGRIDELVLDRFLRPLVRALVPRFLWFRRFQQGVTQHYVLYILVVTLAMLSTLIPGEKLLAFLLTR